VKIGPVLLICLFTANWASPIFSAETNRLPVLRVAAVQFRSSRNLAQNVRGISEAIRRAAKEQARVVVFPECALTGYSEAAITNTSATDLQKAEKELVRSCREAEVFAVVGSPTRDGGRLYNSALVISPDRGVIERYHKIHLAERWSSPGDHLSVFAIDGVPCSIIICHDERYPELVRAPVLAGARVIFYISHESGLSEPKKIEPYRAQIQARAVENSVFVVHANAPSNPDKSGSHGQSRIIAPDGNLIKEASIRDEEIIYATLELKRASGDNARRSLTEGPFQESWGEAVKRVRIIK